MPAEDRPEDPAVTAGPRGRFRGLRESDNPNWERYLWWRVRLWLWVGFVAILGWLVISILHTLVVFGAAFGITLALAPVVQKATQWQIPLLQRKLSWRSSVVLVYVVVTLLFVVAVTAAVPVVVEQARSIAAEIPLEMPRLQGLATDWQQRFDRWKLPPLMKQNIELYLHDGIARLGNWLEHAFDMAASGIMNAFSTLLVITAAYIVAVFILLSYPETSARFYSNIPEPYRTDVRGLVAEINRIFAGFVRGTGILAVMVGCVNYLSLTVLGLVDGLGPFQYTLVVSVLSMVAYLVPILGIIVTLLLAALLAWFQSPTPAYVLTVVLILFLGSTAIDRLAGPRVIGKAMGVSPVFFMFAAFAGAELCGFWGAVLGVPGVAIAKTLLTYCYQRFLTADELPPVRWEETLVGELPPNVAPDAPLGRDLSNAQLQPEATPQL